MSDPALRLAIAVLAVVGLAISAYLTYVHYAGLHTLCLASGGCERVQSSSYAKLAGVPVALLGLLGYAAILLSLLAPPEPQVLGGAAVAIVGFAFSLYLTYRELFTIHAICQWCVASLVVMTVLLGLTLVRALRTPEAQT